MDKIDWKKLPSVTNGGQPYFLVAGGYPSKTDQYCIVWNRIKQRFACQLNGLVVNYVDSFADGKKFFKNYQSNNVVSQ